MKHRTWRLPSAYPLLSPRRHRHFSPQERVDSDINAEDPQGGAGQLQDPPDLALPDGCLRPTPDGLAQLEGRRRVGGQGDGVLGLRERPPRAVGLWAARLDERARRRRDRVAGQGQARVRSAVVDAGHRRHDEGEGVQPHHARRSRRRKSSKPTWRASRRRSRTRSCSSADPGRFPSTSNRQPSARQTKWRGAATTRPPEAAVAARDAADAAAVMSRPHARARCRPPTSTRG